MNRRRLLGPLLLLFSMLLVGWTELGDNFLGIPLKPAVPADGQVWAFSSALQKYTLVAQSGGGTSSGNSVIVQLNDATVGVTQSTIDFSSAFTVVESPTNRAKVGMSFGTTSGKPAQGSDNRFNQDPVLSASVGAVPINNGTNWVSTVGASAQVLHGGTIPSFAPIVDGDITALTITAASLAAGSVTSAKILDGTIVAADVSAVTGTGNTFVMSAAPTISGLLATTNVSVSSQLTVATALFMDTVNPKTAGGPVTFTNNVSVNSEISSPWVYTDKLAAKTVDTPITVTNNVSQSTAASSPTYFTDKISSKTVNTAIAVTANVTVSNDITANGRVFVDTINPKTFGGALNTQNVSSTSATMSAALFADTISSRTASTPIAVTANVSVTSAFSAPTAFQDTLRSATTNTTITLDADGPAGVSVGLNPFSFANGPDGGDALGDILIRTGLTPAYRRLPIGTTNQILTVVGGLPSWQAAGAASFSGDVNTTTNKVLSDGGSLLLAPDYGVIIVKDDDGLTVEHGDGTGGVTMTAIGNATMNVTGSENITGNATSTTYSTDTITSKTVGGPVGISNNVSISNVESSPAYLTDKISSKTANTAITVTANVSATAAVSATSWATVFTDKISSKTVDTPIAVTQNVSGTSVSATGTVFTDTLSPKTGGGGPVTTQNVSGTSASWSSVDYTDKIISKTANTAIATTNVSTSNGLTSVGVLYADTINPRTAGGSVSILGFTSNATPSKFSLSLMPGTVENTGATTDVTLTGVAGTFNNYSQLAYNDTVTTTARYVVPGSVTRAYAGGAVTFRLYWFATATSNSVVWRVQTLSRGSGQVMDAVVNTTTGHTVTSTVAGTTLQLKTADISFTPSAAEMTAGNIWLIHIGRDPANASDTLVGDANLVEVDLWEN